MERTGTRMTDASPRASRKAGRVWAGLALLSGMLALGGCYVVPASYPVAGPAYVAPAPVYVAPAPVYVAPAPVYFWGGYRWRRYGRW